MGSGADNAERATVSELCPSSSGVPVPGADDTDAHTLIFDERVLELADIYEQLRLAAWETHHAKAGSMNAQELLRFVQVWRSMSGLCKRGFMLENALGLHDGCSATASVATTDSESEHPIVDEISQTRMSKDPLR